MEPYKFYRFDIVRMHFVYHIEVQLIIEKKNILINIYQ